MKYSIVGWDPTHCPDTILQSANVVNLGYVINVISDYDERKNTLKTAYDLSQDMLIVSALLDTPSNLATNARPHADGFLTSRNTFQKLYSHSELKTYIQQTLDAEPIAAVPGVFIVFKDKTREEQYLSLRVRRRIDFAKRTPLTLAEQYAPYRELLEDFTNRIYELGRVPFENEYSRIEELKTAVGGAKKAYRIVQALFPNNVIAERTAQRRNDLLVYLALSNFRRFVPATFLPADIQHDMQTFFGSYNKAKEEGKQLLFAAGNPENIITACKESLLGKKLPDDLYVHINYVDRLPALLRVYVGCATEYIGEVENANIVKIHMRSGKVSFLDYQDFDDNPHPRLQHCTKVFLREQTVKYFDYTTRENPPILHRKETFVGQDYTAYSKFAKLTKQEEKAGLLKDAHLIGTLASWEARLVEKGYRLKGHKIERSTYVNTDSSIL